MDKRDNHGMDITKQDIDKAIRACSIGTPAKTALALIGMGKADVLYMQALSLAYSQYEAEEEIAKLKRGKSDLSQARAYAKEGALEEAKPEFVTLCRASATFRKEAKRMRDFEQELKKAEAKAIVMHMTRVAESDSKTELFASEWFLDKMIPTESPTDQAQAQAAKVPQIEVRFVQPSEEATKRIEAIEAEFGGEAKA